MKTLNKNNYKHFGIILLILIVIACKTDQKQNNVIEVITRSMNFQTADTIKSG